MGFLGTKATGDASPVGVAAPGIPDYSANSVVNAPAGFQPMVGGNQDFSGGSQPTIASQIPSFIQNPRGYALQYGLSALGAGPGTTVGKAISNPIGSIVNALTPSSVTNTATASNVANAEADGSALDGTEAAQAGEAADAATDAGSSGSAIEDLF